MGCTFISIDATLSWVRFGLVLRRPGRTTVVSLIAEPVDGNSFCGDCLGNAIDRLDHSVGLQLLLRNEPGEPEAQKRCSISESVVMSVIHSS